VVTMTDLQKVGNGEHSTVDDIATHNVIVVYEDQTLHDALARFGGQDVGRIPVVTRSDHRHLVGVLRRHDIIKAYARQISTTLAGRAGSRP
jgi:CIC family chloride channel protein